MATRRPRSSSPSRLIRAIVIASSLCALTAGLWTHRHLVMDAPPVEAIEPGEALREATTPEKAPDTAITTPPPPERVLAARARIGRTRLYDPAYVSLDYPGGDVPADRGVCTDVVIRALRAEGLDLQQAVHEDMRRHFAAYPKHWGLRGPDRNIDHRRVPNLERWFERQGWELDVDDTPGNYRAGDLVSWMLPGNLPHIGIVSERHGSDGSPLIIHNIGRGTREENVLFAFEITGHYRPQTRPVPR